MARAPQTERTWYKSSAPAYVGNVYREPGQPFATADPKLDEWTKIDRPEAEPGDEDPDAA